MPSDTHTSNGGTGSGAHWSLYVLLGALTGAVLVYGASEQIFDTNFYVLWEAAA